MEKEIVWSHSRINTLLNNPAEYFLSYVEGITPKVEKTALSIGSAIHYGIEKELTDLTDYYNEKGNFRQWNNYSDEQCLAESIVEAYLNRKNEIYNSILEGAELIEVFKELKLVGKLKSEQFNKEHSFLGIIDLLLLTDKGFVLIDYKTSSSSVNWDTYKSQLYKYNFLLRDNFPDIPLYKVCIINLIKTRIKRKRDESDNAFKLRIKEEYKINDELIDYHVFDSNEFDEFQQQKFEQSLVQTIDACDMIVQNKLYFTNYSNINTQYGPSQYADILYRLEDAQFKYIINDTIFDEDENKVVATRNCDAIDMLVLDNKNVLNKYALFKSEVSNMLFKGEQKNIDDCILCLKNKWICSDNLLNKYKLTFLKNI